MNLFTKRFGLVLAGVVGVGAIAALAIGASFALFNAQTPPMSQTFTAGTVGLYAPTSATCTTNVGNMEPGDTGTCTFSVQYGGTLPAYIGVEVARANAVGGLISELELTINKNPFTFGTPILIGNTGGGATSFSATIAYTLPLSAGNAYQGAKGALSATFIAVQCSNNGMLPSGALDPGANESCGDPGPASWSQTPAASSTTPASFYIESDSGTGICDSAYGGSSPCFYPQNVAPGQKSVLTVTVANSGYYADVTTTLTWPTADLTYDSNGDSSANCVAGVSGSNSTEACTYTDFGHSFKSDGFTFTVNSGVSGPVTVGISADATASGGPVSTSEAILNVS